MSSDVVPSWSGDHVGRRLRVLLPYTSVSEVLEDSQMNRVFTLGIAIFFAVVGMALIGGERQVDAAFGCHGCFGGKHCGGLFARHKASCCAPEPTCCAPEPTCCAPEPACCGKKKHCGGLFARLKARRSCCAPEPTCCAPEPTCCAPEPVVCGGCDTGCTSCAPEPTCAAPEAAPAPAPAEASPSEEAPPAPPAAEEA